MLRISLILMAGLLCLLWTIATPASKTYWKNVGYEMDRTLNPNKYEVEAIKGEGNG
jgi:hypothetical protein